jgi:hypothetical protein
MQIHGKGFLGAFFNNGILSVFRNTSACYIFVVLQGLSIPSPFLVLKIKYRSSQCLEE